MGCCGFKWRAELHRARGGWPLAAAKHQLHQHSKTPKHLEDHAISMRVWLNQCHHRSRKKELTKIDLN